MQITAKQLAKFVIFVITKGTCNRRYGYKDWEEAVLFACLKVTGEVDDHISRPRNDDGSWPIVLKPSFSKISATKRNDKFEAWLAANP